MSTTVNEIAPIDKEVEKQIDSFSEKITKITSDMNEEMNKIQRKFEKQMYTVYKDRSQVTKKIPQFWGIVLGNHPSFTGLISDPDTVKALDHLIDITFDENPGTEDGFIIRFEFSPNEYFDNKIIEKKIVLSQKDDEQAVVTGSTINWKEGKNIVDIVNKSNKEAHDKKKKDKGKKDEEDDDDDEFDIDFNQTIFEPLSQGLEFIQIAMIVKEEIFPDPMRYYYADDIEEDLDVDDSFDEDEFDVESGNHKRKRLNDK